MYKDIYTSLTGEVLDEKENCERTCLSFLPAVSCTFSYLFWASQHTLFSYIHIHLPQADVPSSLLQTPLSPCSCYSRVQKERVYPWLLSAPGLRQLFLTLLSGFALLFQVRYLWFFQFEGPGKARHVNPLFICRSGAGQATAIWDFLCCITQRWPLQWSKLLW